MEQPSIEKEQHTAHSECGIYLPPCYLLTLHAFRAQTRKSQEHHGKEFCIKHGGEESRRPLEVHQDAVYHADVEPPCAYGSVAVPIHVDDHQDNTHGTQKIHDFRQCP